MLEITKARERRTLVPDELLDAVVAHFDPVRVILFGSRGERRARTATSIC